MLEFQRNLHFTTFIILDTLGREYLVDDITEFVNKKMCLGETNEFG